MVYVLHSAGGRSSAFDFPIMCTGSSKSADPFDVGGGIVSPNEAAMVGLVYDMDTIDYVDYMCRRGYSELSISRLIGRSVSCMDRSKPMSDINLPAIIVSSLQSLSPVTLKRRVTNVGRPWSTYWAEIESPIGTSVVVSPWVLSFNASMQKMSFKVIVHQLLDVNGGYYFGSLTWTNGVNHIRIPLAVRMDYLPSRITS